ncbi:MAG: MBL fold metallo-hydrolase [Treponema sp.]|nr:MBL fold metallo-hydrolase [Treponema sp.]
MDIAVFQTGPLGVNSYIVPLTEQQVFIVDPAACRATHDQTVLTDWLTARQKQPCGILLTHGHFDHITGIAEIRNAYPNCPIAIHKDDIASLDPNSPESAAAMVSYFGFPELHAIIAALPQADIVIDRQPTLREVFQTTDPAAQDALARWKIIHTPGHSRGSICLYSAADNALISGDTVFFHSYGRTDLPGGNDADMMRSLVHIKTALPSGTIVYPGHDHFGFTIAQGM